MKSIGLAALLSLLAACAAKPTLPQPAPAAAVVADEPVPLLLVSIDGFRADYLDRGLTPTLLQLAAGGVRAEWMNPSFPSLTFPNHYTLVTGLRPDRHGIVNNTMFDADIPGVRFSAANLDAVNDPRWWAQGTPLWVTAQQLGLLASTVFWPGSQTANKGILPNDWLPYSKSLSAADRVDTALSMLARPRSTRPRLLTLYLDTIDIIGHEHGPDSAAVDAALRELDATLQRLLAGLRSLGRLDRINLVIVSDHGMAAVPREQVIVLDDLVPRDMIETPIVGTLAGITPKAGMEAEVERRLLRRHAHMQCWRKGDIPARFRYGSHPRVPPLVCLLDEGWTTNTRSWLERGGAINRGSHGFDPSLASMRALFIARGPAFPHGRVVPAFDNVDVYPLLARLIGVAPMPGDGRDDLPERLGVTAATP